MLDVIFERIRFSNRHVSLDFSSKKEEVKSYISNYLNGPFIAPEAVPIAKKTLKVALTYAYVFQGHRVTVTFLSAKEDVRRVQKLIHLINTVLLIVDALNPSIIHEPVSIYLFDLEFPKLIERGKELDYKHVNTGVSYREKIVVYRREEMGKVLIHELLHRYRFELDKRHSREICQYFGVESINVNEAYVDALAMIIHVAIYAKGHAPTFSKQWRIELRHVYQQALCISRLYHDLYGHQRFVIKEKTNTLSYFVIKAMLYSSLGLRIPIIRGESDRTQELYDTIISQFPITSSFWKQIQGILSDPKDLYSCRHGTSLRMSITDCI